MIESDRPISDAVAELARSAPEAPSFDAIAAGRERRTNPVGSIALATVAMAGAVLTIALVFGVLVSTFGLGFASGAEGGESTLPFIALVAALAAWIGIFVATTRVRRRRPWLALLLAGAALAVTAAGFIFMAALG